MKKAIIATVLAIASLGQALASPAQDLYDQASFYLEFYYHGYSKIDFKANIAAGQKQLEIACGTDENCPFAKATPIILALVESVTDNHTGLLPKAAADALTGNLNGQVATTPAPVLGVQLIRVPKTLSMRIAEVFAGSPAEQAGLSRGDRILKFNNQSFIESEDRAEFIKPFRAITATGEPMILEIERPQADGTYKTFSLTATPKVFQSASLPSLTRVNASTARLYIPTFEIFGQVGQTVHDLVRQAQAQGYTSLVLDVRNDGGGSPYECLSSVTPFIGDVKRLRETRREKGIDGALANGLVYTERNGQKIPVYQIKNPAVWTGKVSVLVNENSASCAEYFASDFQYAKRAPVVGVATVGVGDTGARLFELVSGDSLIVTFTRSFFADGTPYPATIKPDIDAKDDLDGFVTTGLDTALLKASEVAR